MSDSFLLPCEIFLIKAKQDLTLVEKNISDNEIAAEIIYFHLQQAVEKLLKALLDANDVTFKKTHDLYELVDLSMENSMPLPDFVDTLCELTPYAVEARYSILLDDLQNAMEMLEKADRFFEFVKQSIQNIKAGK